MFRASEQRVWPRVTPDMKHRHVETPSASKYAWSPRLRKRKKGIENKDA
jgi:hypothetical protein